MRKTVLTIALCIPLSGVSANAARIDIDHFGGLINGTEVDGFIDYATWNTLTDGIDPVSVLSETTGKTEGEARVSSSVDPQSGELKIRATATPPGANENAKMQAAGRALLQEEFTVAAPGTVTAALAVEGKWLVPNGLGFTAYAQISLVSEGEFFVADVVDSNSIDPTLLTDGSIVDDVLVSLAVKNDDRILIDWYLEAGVDAYQLTGPLSPATVDFGNTAVASLILSDGAVLTGGDPRLFSAQGINEVPVPAALPCLIAALGGLVTLRRRR